MTNTPTTDPKPAPPQPRLALRKLGFVLGALLVAWTVFGQILPRMLYSHSSESAPSLPAASRTDTDIEALLKPRDERIAALEERIKVLEDAAKATPVATAAPAAPANDAQITQLLARIAALSAQVDAWQAGGMHQTAELAAFGTLKDTIVRGEPFTAPLEALAHLATDNEQAKPMLAQLQPLAEGGAPTLASLRLQFTTLLPSALAADDHDNFLTRSLQSLIRVRKVGENQTGNNDEAILARAEAKLERGDLAAAVQETQSLSPKAARVLAAWRADALTLIGAHHALDALELVLAQDTQGAAPPAAAPPVTPPPAPAQE